MNPANRFRVAAIVVAVLMAVYALTSVFSETFSPRQPALPADPSEIATQTIGPTAQLAVTISPFRADLEANYAATVALMALRPDNQAPSAADAQANADSQEEVKRVLKAVPHNSELWLLLALLRTQHKSAGRQIAEALKMSYFTAPNDPQLMPLRLYAVAFSDAVSDPDLKELARGDVRLMLIRQPDLKPSVLFAYRHGSTLGKTFLEDAAQSIDPEFVSVLRKGT
jgi:hypothetical protein